MRKTNEAKKQNSQNATETFETRYNETIAHMATITKMMKTMKANAEQTGGLNWAHAGSMGHVNETLAEIESFLKN
jgi:hypothetical protein